MDSIDAGKREGGMGSRGSGSPQGVALARGVMFRNGGLPVTWHRGTAGRGTGDATHNLRLLIEVFDEMRRRAVTGADRATMDLLTASIAAPATGGSGDARADALLLERIGELRAAILLDRPGDQRLLGLVTELERSVRRAAMAAGGEPAPATATGRGPRPG